MKEKRLANEILKGSDLTAIDAARLVLEAVEALGALAGGKERGKMMALLRRVIHEGVKAVQQAEHTVSFAEAAWASVEARAELRPTSRRDLRNYVRRMLRVEGVGELPLRSMSTKQCRHILGAAFRGSAHSFRKGRAILSSIFTYGIRQEWCDANPVQRIEVPRVQEKRIAPLTADEVERLHKAAERPEHRAMRFSLRLMLYGGIRPAEVSRLQPGDFCWEEGHVLIRPSSSKTGGGRLVPLRGMQGIRKHERTIPRNWQRRWQALRRAAGFRHGSWVPDVCRHSFASYHAAHFKNLPVLQLEMGHRDLTLLRTRYVSPIGAHNGSRYWDEKTALQRRADAL